MSRKQVNGASERALPERRNPLLSPERTPTHPELVDSRHLGRTNLTVKAGQLGLNNATKAENLGRLSYAHLKVPLPKDLDGTEIFTPSQNQPRPTVYYLMRRSSDGCVSATGMFKATFPWARRVEEDAETAYVKAHYAVSPNETAGNVWLSEHQAIELADEYDIVPWVHALLDPKPVPLPEDPDSQDISPPPRFRFTAGDKAHFPPPGNTPARSARASTPKSRGRPRAGSPEKQSSPQKTSKKSRTTKAMKEANAASAREASASLQASLDEAASVADSEPTSDGKVRVDVESTVEKKGQVETTTTNVKIEMPKDSAELPLPESPEEMIGKAKQMVEEAQKLDGDAEPSSRKRKAEELEEDGDTDEDGDSELQPAKRARLLEQQVKKEKVRNRALMGVAATMVIGAIIPYFTG